jgi:hypothetical protein
MLLPYALSVTACSRPSEPMKPSTGKWRTNSVSKLKALGTEWLSTRKPMTKHKMGMSKTHDFQTSKFPLGLASTYLPNGLNDVTMATLPALPPRMGPKTPCTLSPFTPHLPQPMTLPQGRYHIGSEWYLLDQILSSWCSWSMPSSLKTGEL